MRRGAFSWVIVATAVVCMLPLAHAARVGERARNYLSQALGEAMEGKAVSTPTSRPYGCSVKYPGTWF